jgi:hypothetical protein
VRELPFIEAVYLEIDAELERQRTIAEDAGDSPASQRESQRRESMIKRFSCFAGANWRPQLMIRVVPPSAGGEPMQIGRSAGVDRLSGLRFEHRAALVLDRQAGAGSPWAMVMRYYGLRNQIAHGKLVVERIYVDEVVQDLFHIHALLQSQSSGESPFPAALTAARAMAM